MPKFPPTAAGGLWTLQETRTMSGLQTETFSGLPVHDWWLILFTITINNLGGVTQEVRINLNNDFAGGMYDYILINQGTGAITVVAGTARIRIVTVLTGTTSKLAGYIIVNGRATSISDAFALVANLATNGVGTNVTRLIQGQYDGAANLNRIDIGGEAANITLTSGKISLFYADG